MNTPPPPWAVHTCELSMQLLIRPPEGKAVTILKAFLYWLLPFNSAHPALLLPSHLSSDLTCRIWARQPSWSPLALETPEFLDKKSKSQKVLLKVTQLVNGTQGKSLV